MPRTIKGHPLVNSDKASLILQEALLELSKRWQIPLKAFKDALVKLCPDQ